MWESELFTVYRDFIAFQEDSKEECPKTRVPSIAGGYERMYYTTPCNNFQLGEFFVPQPTSYIFIPVESHIRTTMYRANIIETKTWSDETLNTFFINSNNNTTLFYVGPWGINTFNQAFAFNRNEKIVYISKSMDVANSLYSKKWNIYYAAGETLFLKLCKDCNTTPREVIKSFKKSLYTKA